VAQADQPGANLNPWPLFFVLHLTAQGPLPVGWEQAVDRLASANGQIRISEPSPEPANRLDATITLNLLEGRSATNVWYRDANPVSDLFFANSRGALRFRSDDGLLAKIRPRAGLFVCFLGNCKHQVAPSLRAVLRLAFPMTFFTSTTDQPFASGSNRYEPVRTLCDQRNIAQYASAN
jgi:hypothetical protein